MIIMLGLWASMIAARHKHVGFCLGTGVPRHGAVGIGLSVHPYVRGMYCLQYACMSN